MLAANSRFSLAPGIFGGKPVNRTLVKAHDTLNTEKLTNAITGSDLEVKIQKKVLPEPRKKILLSPMKKIFEEEWLMPRNSYNSQLQKSGDSSMQHKHLWESTSTVGSKKKNDGPGSGIFHGTGMEVPCLTDINRSCRESYVNNPLSIKSNMTTGRFWINKGGPVAAKRQNAFGDAYTARCLLLPKGQDREIRQQKAQLFQRAIHKTQTGRNLKIFLNKYGKNMESKSIMLM